MFSKIKVQRFIEEMYPFILSRMNEEEFDIFLDSLVELQGKPDKFYDE